MLVDICQSTYEHAPYEHFGDKRFFKKRNSMDIVCSECLQRWVEDCSNILSGEIIRKIMPIWDNRKDLYENPTCIDPDEESSEDQDSENPETPSESEGEDIPSEGSDTENNENTSSVEDETTNTTEGHVDYTIPEDESKEDESENDLYPWIPDSSKFSEDDLKVSPKIYTRNMFITNTSVNLPEYMKYILCSTADISIVSKPDNHFEATVTFYGACVKPTSSNQVPCNCQNTSDTWTPVSELIAPKKPLHQFRIEIYAIDLATENRLSRRIFAFMCTCINATFDPIPKKIAQALMDNISFDKYHETLSVLPPTHLGTYHTCAKCEIASAVMDFYYYQGSSYCLECMYKIVVNLAVNANLAEEVGLATACDIYSVEYLYRYTRDWKKVVIDRYINAMTKAGDCPEITRL